MRVPISARPATRNEGGCRQVPRLPRQTTADVAKCHACHAKRRRMSPSATPATQSAAVSRGVTGDPSAPPDPQSRNTTLATQNDGGCRQVPRLPRESTADVTKCHACHAKCSGVTRRHGRPQVPSLPRETTADATKCRACHERCRGVTRRHARPKRATRPTVPKYPACQAKRRCT